MRCYRFLRGPFLIFKVALQPVLLCYDSIKMMGYAWQNLAATLTIINLLWFENVFNRLKCIKGASDCEFDKFAGVRSFMFVAMLQQTTKMELLVCDCEQREVSRVWLEVLPGKLSEAAKAAFLARNLQCLAAELSRCNLCASAAHATIFSPVGGWQAEQGSVYLASLASKVERPERPRTLLWLLACNTFLVQLANSWGSLC